MTVLVAHERAHLARLESPSVGPLAIMSITPLVEMLSKLISSVGTSFSRRSLLIRGSFAAARPYGSYGGKTVPPSFCIFFLYPHNPSGSQFG
ncbi:UNVERIFIED_CONTAM: hypothetical protein Sradi_0161000 [Sesamum radiatum]|uniref:Uncharacterized protein n=1 Tax=Sesamum radiatum TaxID=300843 RepID=A0AAW2WLW6_SESRA